MPPERSQDNVDSRKELLRLSGREQQCDAHTIPEIATSDLKWLPSDHYLEVEDEAAADPWDISITDKETSNESTNNTSDTLSHTQTANTADGEPQSETMLPGFGDQRNLFADDDTGVQMGLFADVEEKISKTDRDAISARVRLKRFNALEVWPPGNDVDSISDDSKQIHPTNNNGLVDDQLDIPEQDWLNGGRVGETVDDGFEEFSLEEQTSGEPDDNFDIDEFDSDAQQPLWEIEPEAEDQLLRRARMKAAAITNLLDFRSIVERNSAISYLTELFIEMPYSATFQAIQKVAEGIDLDTLKAMIELRRIWMRRTDWWLGRYDKMFAVAPLKSGASAFTWNTARLVCLARKDYPPESMIDDEWLDEWLQLSSRAPGYLSFPSYIEEKVCYRDIELLNRGLRHLVNSNDHSEVDDSFDWFQPVSDHNKTIQDNFHIITLYRD